MEEREVDEGEARGESLGEASAVEGDESESAWVVRRRAACLAAGTPEAFTEAILASRCRSVASRSGKG